VIERIRGRLPAARCHRLIASALNWQLRRFLRRHPDVTVVAVTGSLGKTTTKITIAAVLGKSLRVRAHPGNYNTDVGVPLSAFGLTSPGDVRQLGKWSQVLLQAERRVWAPSPCDVLVLELGADSVGEIGRFAYLEPDVGIVTAIKPCHLEGFGSMDNIAREKMLLARFSRIALLNADDDRVMSEHATLTNRCYTFGADGGECRMIPGELDWPAGYGGRVQLRDASIPVRTRFVGRHTLPAVAAAAAVGDLLGLGPEEISAGIDAVRPVSGRMNLLRGINGSFVIDDSYNASPDSVTAALATLFHAPASCRIAILGDMNELGGYARDAHELVGEHCARLDHLVTIGPLARELLAPAAIRAGVPPDRVQSFDSPYRAGWYARDLVRPGTVILIKGSQNGVLAEEATAQLIADPRDRALLVRQSASWQDTKLRIFGPPSNPDGRLSGGGDLLAGDQRPGPTSRNGRRHSRRTTA
jgi:UDP-N-acetylmuramoyl-tripeptide--D-alanyl-D-alanine ligase